MRFGPSPRATLVASPAGNMGRVTNGILRRRGVRIIIECCILASLVVTLGLRVFPAQAQQQRSSTATVALYGPSTSAVQAAVNAASWPQQQSNWCGIATIAAIARYRGHAASQQDVVTYLNSSAGVSEWGTPSAVPNEGPGFQGDIARDLGTDPRSLAASLTATGGGTDHVLVDLRDNWDATLHLVSDLLRSNEPISVIVFHGFHSVLVSAVYATDNPLTNPSSITGFEVWDPGVGVPGGNIQPDEADFVPISTWLNSEYYWGSPYAPNYFGNLAADPDPAVGPYTNAPAANENGHLWIGHYVYIRPDGSADAIAAVSPDWEINQGGAVIEGFHGEVPAGYTGPVTSIPIVTQLGDRSFDAPALWSASSYQPLASAFAPAAVLAWVGTDSSHRLNVSVTTDGVNFTNKITLSDRSFTRPSVIVVPNASDTANVVVLAWAGTDAQHSLNVIYDLYGAHQKVTFSERSAFAPSLAYFNGQIWMAWTGTDAAHTVNVRSLGPMGLVLGAKRTLWGNSSNVTPDVVADPQNSQLLLTWQILGSNRLNLFQSPDGVAWSSVLGAPSGQRSQFTPSLMVINPTPADFPTYYLAWTGTDSGQSLNLQRGTAPNAWSGTTTYGLSSISGPLLGYLGQPHQIVMAWTGTDSSHHMYLAIIPV